MRSTQRLATTTVVLAVMVGACGPVRTASPEPQPVVLVQPVQSASADGQEEVDSSAIVALVLRAEKAYLERGDVDAQISIWAHDAVLVRARNREPGPYDVSLGRAQVAAIRRILVATQGPVKETLRVEHVEVDVQGSSATMTWRAVSEGADYAHSFDDRFQLRRATDGWQVVEKRYWPHSKNEGGKTFRFDAAHWRRTDEKIERIRGASDGDERPLVYELFGGYRFQEALARARTLTGLPEPMQWDWEMLGSCALMMGEADEATKALANADTPFD